MSHCLVEEFLISAYEVCSHDHLHLSRQFEENRKGLCSIRFQRAYNMSFIVKETGLNIRGNPLIAIATDGWVPIHSHLQSVNFYKVKP